MTALQLNHNAYGQLCYTDTDGVVHEQVTPVRAFPMSAPDAGVSLVDARGHELVWIAHLDELDAASRAMLDDALASREFMPEIRSIRHVSSYATPSVWQVGTDRGDTEFTLKAEDDIRRLSVSQLLIADSNGVQFLIRDIQQLDKASRKRLDRFL